MKFISQKTKRSCVSVGIYNSFIYWGINPPKINTLRNQLKECKANGGVLWKDLSNWLFHNNINCALHKDNQLKHWNHPNKVCLCVLSYKETNHCVMIKKITNDYVLLINEDKASNFKVEYKMTLSKFKKKLQFYLILNY